MIVSKSSIISAITHWAIRQSPYSFPKNLQEALVALDQAVDKKGIFESTDKKSYPSYKKMETKELHDLLKDLVYNVPEISQWNLTQYEIEKGFTDYNDQNRPVKFGISSRYDHPKEYFDFIDLDALCRNATNLIINEDR